MDVRDEAVNDRPRVKMRDQPVTESDTTATKLS